MIADTNSPCVGADILDFLKKRGIKSVGRYYRRESHPEWKITPAEAAGLANAGIKVFVVFEDHGYANNFNLSEAQGRADARSAVEQARAIGQPGASVIYFAVEGLPDGYTTADLPGVRNYFAGVTAEIAGRFKIGVYGDGIVCKTLLDEGVCSHTWLAQASYAFEGTIDFYDSNRWSLAQIVNELDWKGLSIDINEHNGDIGDFLAQIR